MLAEERQRGQEFLVTIDLDCDTARAGRTDQLMDTVNYASIVDTVKQINAAGPYHLLETFAAKIAAAVLKVAGVYGCTVSVKKPRPPLTAVTEGVAVTIRRESD